MLVTLNEVLNDAQENGYAVGAFNVYNLESAQAVIQGALDTNAPVILNTSPKAIDYAGLTNIAALLLDIAERAPIPVVVHLDHGKDLNLLKNCITNGYSSVMFDASGLPEGERIPQTVTAVNFAHQHRASIEGEQDSIGGKEDYVQGDNNNFTDPDQAAKFVDATDLDAFAVSIGNIHGPALPEETLDIDLLKKIRAKVEIPLVLHGASNTPPTLIKEAITAGICKINIDTELRQHFISQIHHTLVHNRDILDPRDLLTPARDAMTKVVKAKIQLFGSQGRGT